MKNTTLENSVLTGREYENSVLLKIVADSWSVSRISSVLLAGPVAKDGLSAFPTTFSTCENSLRNRIIFFFFFYEKTFKNYEKI